MKTRDRILHVSLALFNEEGEADQSAVDIANALEISPGNLYYHFKGKDAIIRALFERFEEELRIILRGSNSGSLETIEDHWVYLYIILEEIYDFRFFYRELGLLLTRYPDLATRFRGLMKELRATLERLLETLADGETLSVEPRMLEALTDQIMMTLTFWLSNDTITARERTGAHLIHATVFQVMCLIAPHMGELSHRALDAMADYYEDAIA